MKRLAVLAVLTASAAACGEDLVVHPVVGRPWTPDEACLGEEETLDVVEGPAPADCLEPRCLETTDTNELFVSAACEPLAGFADRTDADPPPAGCAEALLAWAEGTYCE